MAGVCYQKAAERVFSVPISGLVHLAIDPSIQHLQNDLTGLRTFIRIKAVRTAKRNALCEWLFGR